MPIAALFDINLDGEDRGFQAANGQSLSLKLRNPSGASTVVFQVYNPAAVDTTLGIAANPPRASNGAPVLTLVGATSGQSVSPTTVGGTVTVAMPGSGSHSYLIRCVVNGGRRPLPNGSTVVDPSLVYERGVYIPTGFSTRKIIATESAQFTVDGWAEAINDLIANGVSPDAFQPAGLGAVLRAVNSRLSDEIHVTDYMTEAEKADARDATMLYDHQPAIQKAIDYAIYRSSGYPSDAPGPRVRLPGAVMRIDSPIQVGYGLGDFRSIVVEGEGMRFGGTNYSNGSGTALIANFNDAPGLVVQGGFNTVLRGFSLLGVLQNHIAGFLNAPSMDDLDVDNWVPPGFPAAATSRYAPYAGIAIDPYAGVRPGTSYPDVDYPGYLAIGAQYGKSLSSNTLIEDVSITGFYVGVVQQPSNADGNGDFTKFQRVAITWCAYGYSWGNSQSRVPVLRDCTFNGVHTAFSTRVFGKQIGEPNFACYSCSFGVIIQLLDIGTLNYGTGPIFYSCFGEALYSLGHLGDNAEVAGTVAFDQCNWGFSLWETYGIPANVLVNDSLSVVAFRGVTFSAPAGTQTWGGFNFQSPQSYGGELENGRCYRFDHCTFVPNFNLPPTQLWQKSVLNATGGLGIAEGVTYLEALSLRLCNAYNLDTGASFGSQIVDTWAQGPRNRCLPAYTRFAKGLHFGGDPGIPVAWRYGGIAASGVITQSGRNITFTVPGADVNYLAFAGGDVGDRLWCRQTGASFWVYARTGDVFSARAMSGFDSAGNLLTPIPNDAEFSTTHCRRYCVGGCTLFGDITSGSPIISNIAQGDNGAPNLPTLVSVADYLYVDGDYDMIIGPYGDNRISSIDNTAKTITMAGNFLRTRSRMRLGIFVRPGLPNGTATP